VGVKAPVPGSYRSAEANVVVAHVRQRREPDPTKRIADPASRALDDSPVGKNLPDVGSKQFVLVADSHDQNSPVGQTNDPRRKFLDCRAPGQAPRLDRR